MFASPTTRDHVGRVVAPVTINGKGPFRFIVDTGPNHSTISQGLVRTLGFTTKSLMVDFQHNRVAIAHDVARNVRTASTKIHALRLTHGLMTLETRAGALRVQAVVDTGSERTLGNLAELGRQRAASWRLATEEVALRRSLEVNQQLDATVMRSPSASHYFAFPPAGVSP